MVQRGNLLFAGGAGQVGVCVHCDGICWRASPRWWRWSCLVLSRTSYLTALERLPRMSVILCHGDDGRERAVYMPVEPADPFMEALRTRT